MKWKLNNTIYLSFKIKFVDFLSFCTELYISIVGMKQDISMAVPALIPPRAKLMFSSREETWLATVSSSTLSLFFFLSFFLVLMQSNDTTLICQHKSKFSLERPTVNWENWTVHVGSPRSGIWSSFYTQPTVPPIRETDTESKAEWQVLYLQQRRVMEI